MEIKSFAEPLKIYIIHIDTVLRIYVRIKENCTFRNVKILPNAVFLDAIWVTCIKKAFYNTMFHYYILKESSKT